MTGQDSPKHCCRRGRALCDEQAHTMTCQALLDVHMAADDLQAHTMICEDSLLDVEALVFEWRSKSTWW